MEKETDIILPSDSRAATFEKVEGWVSRNRLFYGKDEQMARYEGATHKECQDCGKIIRKEDLVVCDECKEKHDIERYNRRERRKWDKETLLYSDAYDEYFEEWDQIGDYCDINECSIEDLRLIICEPNYACQIPDDYWCDDLPDDGETDLPEDLVDALEELNKFIREEKIILSWSPGKYAVDLTQID